MKQTSDIALKLASLSVYKGVLHQSVPKALYRLVWATQTTSKEVALAWGALIQALADEHKTQQMANAVLQAILYDYNVLALSAAARDIHLEHSLKQVAQRDLSVLMELASITPQDILNECPFAEELENLDLPKWETGEAMLLQGTSDQVLLYLTQFYREHGCGIFAKYHAFIWRNQTIVPVEFPDPVQVSDLKDYEEQRQLILDNTEAFLSGLPANNCLLYGDRGTGKSSTIKAVLNQYCSKGLRMIEMPKEFLMDFPDLVAQVAHLPMRFIILIDDLSFSRQDDTYTSLKSVLEGGIAVRPNNMLIYATSNRRHLVRETFSDRDGDEVHHADTVQESLSLADRFGLSVNFSVPDKQKYLEIVTEMAKQRGMQRYLDELLHGAEQWAIARGGRSPRCAQQYMNFAEATIKYRKNI